MQDGNRALLEGRKLAGLCQAQQSRAAVRSEPQPPSPAFLVFQPPSQAVNTTASCVHKAAFARTTGSV